MLFGKVRSTRADNVLTYDLHLPTWPFFAVAWAGDVAAVRPDRRAHLRDCIFHPEQLAPDPISQGAGMRRTR